MPSTAILLAVFGLVSCVAAQSSSASAAGAKATHIVTVANNLTATNGSAVFTPQVINAVLGDTIVFNFTQGNHSATQSDFATPCQPLHDTNATKNGFNTDLRPAGNGTSPTQFTLIMNPDIANDTIWFYDQTTCGIGGVGVINPGNVSATLQTIDGFERNAVRLNGTGATSSSSAKPSATGSTSSGTGSGSGSGSGSDGSGSNSTGAAVRLAPAAVLAPALFALGAFLV